MKDVQDMTDEEYSLHRMRQMAARAYREAGFGDYANEVERGERDECQQMRVARFVIGPTPPHDAAFIAAWDELAQGR